MHKILLTTLTLALCTFGFAVTANAADSSSPAMSQQKGQTTVSQAELEKMAATYQTVTAIRNEYTAKLKGAANKAEAQKIANKAQEEMKEAIRNHGLTMKEYSRMIKVIGSNPKLLEQFRTAVKNGGAGA